MEKTAASIFQHLVESLTRGLEHVIAANVFWQALGIKWLVRW